MSVYLSVCCQVSGVFSLYISIYFIHQGSFILVNLSFSPCYTFINDCACVYCGLCALSTVHSSGVPYCLLHYHSFSTHGKDDTIKAIVTNDEEAAKQQPAVEKVLREAMTSVLLRMHEYQQQEQRALRADPLSVLALHAPSSTSTAASLDVSAPINLQQQRQKQTCTATESISHTKKLKKDDIWHLSRGSEEQNWDTHQQSELLRQVCGDNKDDANEYLYSAGPPCSTCSSSETLVKYDSSMSSMSGTRSEIWGNKDNEGGHSKATIVCKACGFEKIEFS